MLVNLGQNRMVQTIHNFEPFDEKWLTIFDAFTADAIWEDVSTSLNAKLLISGLPSVSLPKVRYSDTYTG